MYKGSSGRGLLKIALCKINYCRIVIHRLNFGITKKSNEYRICTKWKVNHMGHILTHNSPFSVGQRPKEGPIYQNKHG